MSLELKINQVFNLSKVVGDKENQGDDRVTTVDLSFSGEIDGDTADKFCHNEEYFTDTLWKDTEGKEVRHPQMGTFSINNKYENHQIKVFSPILEDSDPLMVLNGANITAINLKPSDGGLATVKFKVHGVVAENEAIGKLFNEYLETDIKLLIQPQQTDLVSEANSQDDDG